jgi:hypothetical protein
VAIALAWKRITDGLSSGRQTIWDGSQHAINAGGIVRADGLARRETDLFFGLAILPKFQSIDFHQEKLFSRSRLTLFRVLLL